MGYGVLHYHFFGCGFIELLMVGERYRRRGVGLVLITALKSHCRHPKLFTSTNRSNLPMQRLLLNAGFVASGQIDNLDDGDPEQVFLSRRANKAGHRPPAVAASADVAISGIEGQQREEQHGKRGQNLTSPCFDS